MVATFTTNPNAFYTTVNRYGGRCHSCLHEINVGEEMLYRRNDKRMHHTACPINQPLTLEELGIETETETSVSADAPAIVDGYYTVETEQGEHRTFRIRTQAQDANFAPGQRVIATLTGSDNTNDYTGWGFVTDNGIRVWNSRKGKIGNWLELATALITGNWKSAGLTYATQSGNCYICGRLLTVTSSVEAGVGPICAKKL